MPTRSTRSRTAGTPSSRGSHDHAASKARDHEVTSMRVGFIGWRGMVGSVLMQRMREEGDFALIDPEFFTTSNVGGNGPDVGRGAQPLKNASDIAALSRLDAIVTCQGGDYTSD